MKEKINKKNLERVIETYKYMFWNATGLGNDIIDVTIDPSISDDGFELLEIIMLFNVDTVAGPQLEDLLRTLKTIEEKIHSFLSQCQISARGKIIHSGSKKLKYNGCMVSSITYGYLNEQLIMLLEYQYETEEII